MPDINLYQTTRRVISDILNKEELLPEDVATALDAIDRISNFNNHNPRQLSEHLSVVKNLLKTFLSIMPRTENHSIVIVHGLKNLPLNGLSDGDVINTSALYLEYIDGPLRNEAAYAFADNGALSCLQHGNFSLDDLEKDSYKTLTFLFDCFDVAARCLNKGAGEYLVSRLLTNPVSGLSNLSVGLIHYLMAESEEMYWKLDEVLAFDNENVSLRISEIKDILQKTISAGLCDDAIFSPDNDEITRTKMASILTGLHLKDQYEGLIDRKLKFDLDVAIHPENPFEDLKSKDKIIHLVSHADLSKNAESPLFAEYLMYYDTIIFDDSPFNPKDISRIIDSLLRIDWNVPVDEKYSAKVEKNLLNIFKVIKSSCIDNNCDETLRNAAKYQLTERMADYERTRFIRIVKELFPEDPSLRRADINTDFSI